MTETADNKSDTPLNDVMIAMDVVDTLRHDEDIAHRELNDEVRRADLIKRLRELYRSQGIEVPDRILEEGVKALEEERFAYDPPGNDWRRKLAEIYVTRDSWGKWVQGAAIGLFAVVVGWQLFYEQPRRREAARIQSELTQELPASYDNLIAGVKKSGADAEVMALAQRVKQDGLAAAKARDIAGARNARDKLKALSSELQQSFKIKIVQRRGELSGLWRIPKVNPSARNYYLIVEAVRDDGGVVTRTITNEEDSTRAAVKKWAVRVPRAVLERVQADKSDDGIIQNAIVGEKLRGQLNPKWFIDVSGGTLTRW